MSELETTAFITREQELIQHFSNNYILRTIDEAPKFTPELPVIKYASIADSFFKRKQIEYENLRLSGQKFYQSLIAGIITERLIVSHLNEYINLATDIRLITCWENIYYEQLKENGVSELHHGSLFAYLGALRKCEQCYSAKNFVTIILEPLLRQFPIPNYNREPDAITKVSEIVPYFEKTILYTKSGDDADREPNIFIIQFFYGPSVLGTGSGYTIPEAEFNAAVNALNNEALLVDIRGHIESNFNPNPEMQQRGQPHLETNTTNPLPLDINFPEDYNDSFKNIKADNIKEQLNLLLARNMVSPASYSISKIENSYKLNIFCHIKGTKVATTIARNKKIGTKYLAYCIMQNFQLFEGFLN